MYCIEAITGRPNCYGLVLKSYNRVSNLMDLLVKGLWLVVVIHDHVIEINQIIGSLTNGKEQKNWYT